jgi:hypothetical protein
MPTLPARAKRQEDPASPITQIMKRIDESEGATEDEKEEIRRAIIRDLQVFDPRATQESIQIPKHFPLKFFAKGERMKPARSLARPG